MSSDRSARAEPPRLGPLEEQVMEVLWGQGPATVREIIAHLPKEPAYSTIATVLANLGRKGVVSSRRRGRSTLFDAAVSQEALAARQMGHLLDASRDRASSILHFVDTMPDSDLELLRDYLRQRDGGQGWS